MQSIYSNLLKSQVGVCNSDQSLHFLRNVDVLGRSEPQVRMRRYMHECVVARHQTAQAPFETVCGFCTLGLERAGLWPFGCHGY